MIREALEDTVLKVPNPPGVEGEKLVPLLKGAQVTIDVVGIRECCLYSSLTTFDQKIHLSPWPISRVQPSLLPRALRVQAVAMVQCGRSGGIGSVYCIQHRCASSLLCRYSTRRTL